MKNFLVESYVDHRELHVLTPSYPTRRSADLPARAPRDAGSGLAAAALRRPGGQYRGVGEEAVLAVEAHLVAVDHHRVAGRLAVRPLPPLPVPAVVLEPPEAAVAAFAGIARGAGRVPAGVDFQRAGGAVHGAVEQGGAGGSEGRRVGGGGVRH